MKLPVLVLIAVISTVSSVKHRSRRFPYEEILDAATEGYGPVSQGEKMPPPSLAGIVFHPEYEQNIYDLVQNPDLICCVTVTDQNGESVEINNNPCVLAPPKHGAEKLEGENTALQFQYKKIGEVFRQILSETLLQIVESLLEAFEEPAPLHSRQSKRKPGHSRPHSHPQKDTQSLPYPFSRVTQPKGHKNNIQQLLGQVVEGPNGDLGDNYDCFYYL